MGALDQLTLLEQPLADEALTAEEAPPSASALAVKRALDVVVALVLVLLIAPLLLVLAVLIRLDSPGPALFRQDRIGRQGRPFRVFKLRTMRTDADELRDALRASSRDPDWLLVDDDPRTTRLGRLLRRSSLDELPQLWNVVLGDMSLVGPRPLIPGEDARVPAWARCRGDVRPGITGLWQVSGRTRISFAGMLQLDRRYVRSWSLARDLVLLVRTVPVVLGCRGAN